jgi:nicotinic acid phosphoribosyltransferase
MNKSFQALWNIMLASDSYKATHHRMLPKGLTYMESYGESRGGEIPYTVFFGLRYYIQCYLEGVQVTEEKIKEAVEFYNEHYGVDSVFNESDWRHILTKYGGKLPITIKALKEGTITKTKTVLYKIHPCDEAIYDEKVVFLVNWIETLIMKTWYPITISSNSAMGKSILNNYAEISCDNPFTDFMLVDFGYRGVSSEETAWIGGASHLLSFKSTDNVAGIRMLKHFYDAKQMTGFSVPATEHMVMTIRGRENEIETYRDILSKHGKDTKFSKLPLSLVSDTYDVYAVCNFLFDDEECRNLIIEREGPVVVRPDSGDPLTILNGNIKVKKIINTDTYSEFLEICEEYLYDEISENTPHGEYGGNISGCFKWNDEHYDVSYTPYWNRYDKQFYFIEKTINNIKAEKMNLTDENIGIVNILANKFGYTINKKGYKVLNHVKVLQGDGITIKTMSEIIHELVIVQKWSLDNFVFGSGGGLLQKVDRDTMKFAIKACYAIVNGNDIDVYKDPITSGGSKTSKKGEQFVIRDGYQYISVNRHDILYAKELDCLEVVLSYGDMYNIPTYDSVMEIYQDHFKHTFATLNVV